MELTRSSASTQLKVQRTVRCRQIEAYQRSNASAPMYPPELVAACAVQLAARADLTAYSTAAAARDIDMVRRALGYDQLDLNAVSYGTTLALRYIAEYPDHVRAAALVGTVPPERTPPRYHAAAADHALSMVIADCANDKACTVAFGDVSKDLDQALALVAKSTDPLRRDLFMENLRTLMYTPLGQRRIPFLLHRAAQGDFAPFDAATQTAGDRSFADGLYLAITCAETFSRIEVAAAIAAAAKTRFGSYRLTRQAAACKSWPHAAPDPGLISRAAFATPVLFMAGERDPVSPAQWASETLQRFRNGRLQVVRHGGHVFDGLAALDTCFDRIVIDFFDQASADRLDMSCQSQMLPPLYQVSAGK